MDPKDKKLADSLLQRLSDLAQREAVPDVDVRNAVLRALRPTKVSQDTETSAWPLGLVACCSGLAAAAAMMLAAEPFQVVFEPLSMIFNLYPPTQW